MNKQIEKIHSLIRDRSAPNLPQLLGEGPEFEHLVSLLQTFHIKVIRHGHNRQINSFIITIDHIRVMPQDRSF